MQIVSSIAAMQRLAKKWQRAGTRIGFVPTMGYLHAGHLSLVKRARQAVGKNSKVVVSIYVNPTQFAPTEDLSKYPRDLKRDLKSLRELGVDVVLTPEDAEMYPNKSANRFSTYVVEEKLSRAMEGASRPTHFRGVTTVVAKLFNIVLPDVAVFGQKDFQQATIIKRMVEDLNFPRANHRCADVARAGRSGDEFAQQISKRGTTRAGGDFISRAASRESRRAKKIHFRRAFEKRFTKIHHCRTAGKIGLCRIF